MGSRVLPGTGPAPGTAPGTASGLAPTTPTTWGDSTGNQFRLGIGLVAGNFDTTAASGDESLAKLATHFDSKTFQKIITDLYSTITNGYTANYTYAYGAIADAINQAGKSGLTLAEGYDINGATSKSGTWGNFATSKSPSGGNGAGNGNGAGPSYGSYGPGLTDMSANAELTAYAQVLGNLNAWGLDSLSDKAWQMISDPGYHLNAGMVMQEIRNTPEYKAAFPGMDEIQSKGLNMTENQYLNHKMDIQDQFANAGIPNKMLTPEEMGKLISNGVYQGNLGARLQKGYEMVKNADPYIKKTLQDWYGVKPGHLLAYMVSPKHGQAQIVKEVQTAMINTEAHNAKFNGLDQKTAEQLSKQMTSSGYGMDYYRTGFAKAAGEQPLEQAQLGQMGQATTSQQQILAGNFAGLKEKNVGSQAEAQHAIDLASQARTAGLQGGGGYVQNAQGGLGIGSASTEGTGK